MTPNKLNHRHTTYTSVPTSAIKILSVVDELFVADPLKVLHKIVSKFNDDLKNSSALDIDLLNAFYTVLCYEYQHHYVNSSTETQRKSFHLSDEHLINIINILVNNEDNEIKIILFHIVILQTVLYCDDENFRKIFSYLSEHKELCHKYDACNKMIHLEIIDCLIDSLCLKFENKRIIDEIFSIIINEISAYFTIIENSDWKLFIEIITKAIQLFDQQLILQNLWEMILNYKHDDTERPLTLLSSVINDILSLSNEYTVILNSAYCGHENLWELIQWGIVCNVEQNRKQALYCMKRILSFIENQSTQKSSMKNGFLVHCPKFQEQKTAIQELKNNFFLILESLEEKQVHFIMPLMKHLENLIKFSYDHSKCNNCLDSKWIACIFERILKHKTNLVIKTGLINLINMNIHFYNDKFVYLLLKGFNNTFIFNNPDAKCLPKVVTDLSRLLITAEQNGVGLIKNIINSSININWSPIPLFYLIVALKEAATSLERVDYNVLTETEITSIIKIINMNSKLPSESLKKIQIKYVYEIFINLIKCGVDLETLAPLLYIFRRDLSAIHPPTFPEKFIGYVKTQIERENAEDYLNCVVKNITSEISIDEVNIQTYAYMLTCLFDAHLIPDHHFTRELVNNIFRLINDIDMRPYVNKCQYLKVLQFLRYFLEKSYGQSRYDEICDLVNPFLLSVMNIIVKKLLPVTELSYEESAIPIACFKIISSKNIIGLKNIDEQAFHLIKSYGNIVDNMKNIKYWFGLNIMAISLAKSSKMSNADGILTELNVQKFLVDAVHRELKIVDKTDCTERKIISECYTRTAELLYLFSKSSWLMRSEYEKWIKNMFDFVKIGKENVVKWIIDTLDILLSIKSNTIIDDNTIISIIDISFLYLWDLNKNELYWSSMNSLLRFIFSDFCLKNEKLIKIAEKHINTVVIESQKSFKLKYCLLNNLGLRIKSATHFYRIIISIYLDSHIEENTKFTKHIYHYLLANKSYYHYDLVNEQWEKILIQLFWTKILDGCSENKNGKYSVIENILIYLTSELKKYTNKRYFENSNIHRTKHRIMQLLLILQPYLNEKDTEKLHDIIGDFLITENNQLTVRLMQEWILIRIYLNLYCDNRVNMIVAGRKSLRSKIWNLLENGKRTRPGSVTSIAFIIYHVCRKLSGEDQIAYAKEAVLKLVPSCLSQKFIVRLYSQVVVKNILAIFPSETAEYEILRTAIEESISTGDLKGNSAKLSEDFLFSKFDPVKDYTVETLFYELPRLSNTLIDECIPYEEFSSKCLLPNTLRIRNLESQLVSLKPLSHPPKHPCGSGDNTIHEAEIDADNSAILQKKTIPSKSMIPIDNDSFKISDIRQQKMADDVGMILVASLIDAIPNLGGISRTAEIFCARKLVLKSKKYTEMKEFQTLSVSADKWIDIDEVKPHELREYLITKSKMGWSIVGAEQTTKSLNLLDMKFGKKTVLILGNEKTGIPADLIPLLDVCIEIPQAGVVRSLNVHVTGAICMWEYAKQHIF